MIKGIGHIGIGVKNIDESLAALSKTFGIPVPPVKEVPEKQSRVALMQLGPIDLELIQDDSENGLLATFVREKGEGIHHFCVITDDITSDIALLKERGVEMLHEQPRIGLRDKEIAFTQPSAGGGVYIELSEP